MQGTHELIYAQRRLSLKNKLSTSTPSSKTIFSRQMISLLAFSEQVCYSNQLIRSVNLNDVNPLQDHIRPKNHLFFPIFCSCFGKIAVISSMIWPELSNKLYLKEENIPQILFDNVNSVGEKSKGAFFLQFLYFFRFIHHIFQQIVTYFTDLTK